jgi:hypothetical protein
LSVKITNSIEFKKGKMRSKSGVEATAVQTLARSWGVSGFSEAFGLSTLRSTATEDGRRVHRRFSLALPRGIDSLSPASPEQS